MAECTLDYIPKETPSQEALAAGAVPPDNVFRATLNELPYGTRKSLSADSDDDRHGHYQRQS